MGAVRGRLYWEDRHICQYDSSTDSDTVTYAASSSSLPVTEILIAVAVILVILFLLNKCQKATDEQIQTVSAAISKLIVYALCGVVFIVLPLAILLFGCEYYNYAPKNAKEFICLFGLIANLILWPIVLLLRLMDSNSPQKEAPRTPPEPPAQREPAPPTASPQTADEPSPRDSSCRRGYAHTQHKR